MRAGLFQYDPQPGVVPPGSITNAELADMAALTVKANATNATASPQDVAASANDQVFRRTSDTLNWGGVTNGMLTTNSIGLDKLVNASAQYQILGRRTTGAGAWEDSTALQLQLPRLDLANTFSLSQSIVTTVAGGWAVTGDGVNVSNTIARYQSNNGGGNITFLKARGSLATPTVVNSADSLGTLAFSGYDSTQFVTVVRIVGSMAQTSPGTTQMGGKLVVEIVPAGSVSTSEILRLDHTNGLQAFGTNVFLDTNRIFRLRVYTVATLPAAGTAGRRAAVSDALAPAYGAVVAGGGAVNIPVYDNGAAWVTA